MARKFTLQRNPTANKSDVTEVVKDLLSSAKETPTTSTTESEVVSSLDTSVNSYKNLSTNSSSVALSENNDIGQQLIESKRDIQSATPSIIPSIEQVIKPIIIPQNIQPTEPVKTYLNTPINQVLNISPAILSEWHTKAEQKVYEAMYFDVLAYQSVQRYFTSKYLIKRSGIKSETTIRTALKGLVEKKSIDLIDGKEGEKLGFKYLVYSPNEIMFNREQQGIKIDSQTKKIIS